MVLTTLMDFHCFSEEEFLERVPLLSAHVNRLEGWELKQASEARHGVQLMACHCPRHATQI